MRIDRDIAVQGPGSNLLTISGGNATRIFFIEGATVRIDGVTLADGLGRGGEGAQGTGGSGGGGGAGGMGGAIFLNSGSLILNGVVLSGNRAVGGNGGNGGSTWGVGEGGGGGGFGGNGALGPGGAGATGDLRGDGPSRAGSGGAGGDSVAARAGGGDAGFGGGGGGGALTVSGGGPGGGNGFGGGAGGAAGFLDPDGTAVSSSGGLGGAALGGAIFVRFGFVQVSDTSFLGNSATGGLGAAGSADGPAKGGAMFLCAAGMCGPGAEAAATWSGNTSFRGNTADLRAGEGCPGRGDSDVCGRLSSSRATHFAVSAPPSTPPGVPFTVVVTALDADEIPVITYAGTVRLSSSDEALLLSSDTRFSAGAGTFTITLKTPGTHTIRATDTTGGSMDGHSNAVEVIRQ
jgi:hypothetical protein